MLKDAVLVEEATDGVPDEVSMLKGHSVVQEERRHARDNVIVVHHPGVAGMFAARIHVIAKLICKGSVANGGLPKCHQLHKLPAKRLRQPC